MEDFQPVISADRRKYVSPSFAASDPFYPTIQQAINSITDATLTNPYGIYVYPGLYLESIVLKSYVSVIGSGVQSTIIKGNGTSPAITGASADAGSSQCYVVGLSIDGNGRSACVFNDTTTSKTTFLVDVYVYTSASALSQTAITIGSKQLLVTFSMHFINQSTKFNEGILTTTDGELRLHSSQIAYVNSYCIDHQSSGYSEAYNSFLVGGSCVKGTNGFVNLYLCQTVGYIDAYSASKIKYVDSLHAGVCNVRDNATLWISGMQGAEEAGNDIQVKLYSSGKAIVSNSRLKTFSSSFDVVTIYSPTAVFKAANSMLVSTGSGVTIRGMEGTPTVYLFYCTLSSNVANVTIYQPDSRWVVTSNAE